MGGGGSQDTSKAPRGASDEGPQPGTSKEGGGRDKAVLLLVRLANQATNDRWDGPRISAVAGAVHEAVLEADPSLGLAFPRDNLENQFKWAAANKNTPRVVQQAIIEAVARVKSAAEAPALPPSRVDEGGSNSFHVQLEQDNNQKHGKATKKEAKDQNTRAGAATTGSPQLEQVLSPGGGLPLAAAVMGDNGW